jgi:hypothetical protein
VFTAPDALGDIVAVHEEAVLRWAALSACHVVGGAVYGPRVLGRCLGAGGNGRARQDQATEGGQGK